MQRKNLCRKSVSQLPSVGETFVVRSLVDEEQGYRWSISMTNLNGNIVSFESETDNVEFKSVEGGKCEIETIIDGNEIGGSFTLTYKKETTSVRFVMTQMHQKLPMHI